MYRLALLAFRFNSRSICMLVFQSSSDLVLIARLCCLVLSIDMLFNSLVQNGRSVLAFGGFPRGRNGCTAILANF